MSDYGRIILSDPVNVAHPLNRGLVAWWLALPQWSGGNTWFDLCRRNNGALTNGPAWRPASRPGGFGELSFDGADDYVQLVAGQTISNLANCSIAAWIKTSHAGSASGKPIYCERAAAGNDIWKFQMSDTSGGLATRLQLVHRDDAGSLSRVAGTTAINDGAWHHVALSKTGTAITLYLDGKQEATGSLSGTDTFTNSGLETWAGRDKGDATVFWSGSMDDLRPYNRALPAAEVAALYDLGRRGYPGVLRRMKPAWSIPATAVAVVTPETIVIPARKTTIVIRERKTTITVPVRKTTIVIPERVV